ncbi:MAG: nicotinate-nucleotide--dimethylbenzimidazole phosphoribosyltransferase [Reinekea sp.]|nr:nicotinate-nucleotide--dimethylbenzimidazole phosphoribosyltransferase [Reinekea sp.]
MSISFNIVPVSTSAVEHLNAYTRALGLPTHSLGMLENVVQKLACIQNSHDIELQQLRHLVFCGDHGIYDRSHQANLSPLSSLDHVNRLLKGQAPVAKACQKHQVDLTVIDCGLVGEELSPRPNLMTQKVAQGTRDFSMMPAMTEDELERAVKIGAEQASMKMAEGARVLSFGALGLGNTTSAAAICMAMLDISSEAAVTNQNRHDPMLNRDKIDVLTQSLALHREHLTDGWRIVQYLGGLEIAAIMGAMASTAELGGMFLVDGFACSAAMLALHSMYPNITDYAQFTHQSSHTAQHAIMKSLGERPLLNLHLALGEGTGSVLTWPLIVSAVDFLQKA